MDLYLDEVCFGTHDGHGVCLGEQGNSPIPGSGVRLRGERNEALRQEELSGLSGP
jgi:hypothetical protein